VQLATGGAPVRAPLAPQLSKPGDGAGLAEPHSACADARGAPRRVRAGAQLGNRRSRDDDGGLGAALLGHRCDHLAPAVREVLVQAWTLLKVTATPALLMAIPIGAIVSIQTAGLVNQVGASSLVGAASGVGVVRQGAPVTAGLLMAVQRHRDRLRSRRAGDPRRTRCAQGARHQSGTPPRRPRFLALQIIAPMLCAIIIASAVAASFILAVGVSGVTTGSFWQSFGTFASVTDVWFTLASR